MEVRDVGPDAALRELTGSDFLYGGLRFSRLALLVAIGAMAAIGACDRYEYRPLSCPTQPASRSAIAWQRTPDAHAIAGSVVDLEARPVQDAFVVLDSSSRLARTSSEGAFRFTDVALGRHTVLVRRIGYEHVEKQLDLVADSGARVLAALELRPHIFDSCPLVETRVRVPWWKFW